MEKARKSLKRLSRRMTGRQSSNASATSSSNSNRNSIDSHAPGAHYGLGDVAGSTDPTASGNDARLNKYPTPSRPAGSPSSSVPDILGSAVDKGHGSVTTRISTPTPWALAGSGMITAGLLVDEPTGPLPPLDSNAALRQGFTTWSNSATHNMSYSLGITPFSPSVDHAGIERESQRNRLLNTMGPVAAVGDERQGSLGRSLTIPDALLPGHQAQDSNSKSTVKDVLVVACTGMEMLLKKVERCLGGTSAKVPIAVITALLDIKNAVGANKGAIEELINQTTDRLLAVDDAVGQLVVPQSGNPRMMAFTMTLRDEIQKLKKMSAKGTFRRALENEADKKEIDDSFKRIAEATTTFHVAISCTNGRTGDEILSKMELEKLRAVHACKAIYNADLGGGATVIRRPCPAGTYEEVVEDIITWANDISADSLPVFCLAYEAGSGKTTIAYTIAQHFDEHETEHAGRHIVLGGTFFCSRQFETTRRQINIIPTLVYQLARKSGSYLRAFREADKFDSVNKPLKQMEDLLVGPWQQSESHRHAELPPYYLIVVDALDEIEAHEGCMFLQDLLKTIDQDYLRGLKFLVTSQADHCVAKLCETFSSKVICYPQDTDKIELEATAPLADSLFSSAEMYLTADPSVALGEQRDRLSELQVGQSIAASSVSAGMFECAEGMTFEGGTFLNTSGHLNYVQAGSVLQSHEQNSPLQRQVSMFKNSKNFVFKRDAMVLSSAGGLNYYAPPPALPPAITSN